jgi:hypothetical protein
MYSLKNDLRKLNQHVRKTEHLSFACDEDFNATLFLSGVERQYVPTPTLLKFHQTLGNSVVSSVMGPYGSGKSTGLNWQVLFCATQMMPPCLDGVRRSKFVFVRNTYDELRQTTYELWMSWFGEVGDCRSTLKPLEVKHTFYDELGKIELYIQFLAVDKPAQFKKLKSSFFTAAYLNEVSELPEGIISEVLGRTGRYPSADLIDTSKITNWYERDILDDGEWKKIKIPYWSGVLCDTNPPESESELFNIFEITKPRGYQILKQPPGLLKTKLGWEINRNAENLERLGLDYYAKQAANATEEFIRVKCCGEYGSIRAGKLVYENYNDDIHAVDSLEALKDVPIRLGFDTWYNPACVIYQYASGQMRILASLVAEHMTLETFVVDILKPFLNENYNRFEISSVDVDPVALMGENVKGATSDYQILCQAFKSDGASIVKPAPTNKTKPRIQAVEHLLKRIVQGKPALILDKKHANELRQGFLKHYVWREQKVNGEIIFEPRKNKSSHTQDALQYAALSIVGILDAENVKPGTYLKPVAQAGGYYAAYY